MLKTLFAVAALLSLAAPVRAGDVLIDVKGEIGIDPQGNVYAVDVKTVVHPQVAEMVRKSAMQWKFSPIIRNGKAVYAKTNMSLTLAAKKVDAGYQLQVENARFLGPRRQAVSMEPPRYPLDAVRAGIGGNVLIAVRVDAEGKVIDAAMVQYSLPYRNLGDKAAERWGKVFGGASIEAVKRFRYMPANPAEGEEPEATIIVPMDFRLGDTPPQPVAGWHDEGASKRMPIPWLQAQQQSFDATGLRQGESLSLGVPVIQPITAIQGMML